MPDSVSVAGVSIPSEKGRTWQVKMCIRDRDMDVYDLAEWCCMAELTRLSIENGNAPVAVPDFTRGSWNKAVSYTHLPRTRV